MTKNTSITTIRIYQVTLSDGENEWPETIKARDIDHLNDIIDAAEWDVIDCKLMAQIAKGSNDVSMRDFLNEFVHPLCRNN